MNKKGLGKGLSALISDDNINEIDQAYIPKLEITKIIPNPYQPRSIIKKEDVAELAESIKEHGVIEPLIVTRSKEDKGIYELIAGERRLEGAKLAGQETVPVVVKEASPQQMLELAVVENVQRSDLNPLEEGMAFEQLATEFNLNHSEISQKVGLSRSAVANKIRLLNLPLNIRKGLLENKISEGHARAILGLEDKQVMTQVYDKVVKNGMSVRALEELVRRLNQGKKLKKQKNERILDKKTQSIETTLKKSISSNITLSRSKRGGKIVIPFKNDEELDEIYKKLV